ncbi:YTH domain-containing protein ECT4-like isoform X2 [Magnolia sinica]|uniref:YTH domain-containing protein ECT4-like isoform X2 n=1 Tax=Magnolia sinica TaxID=86752 RepID=UPI002659C712|nr:YTH domain-containing protein ECT4-like isoform X2 [Magnolia sinica]
MATELKQQKPLEGVMKNLKIDRPSDVSHPTMVASKDGSPSDATSCISSSGDATGSVKESEVDHESLMAEQGVYYSPSSYYGYYYPGYDASFGEWDDQGYFYGTDGLDQYPAFPADNGSLLYYMPGFQPGYNPYSPYSPGGMVGVDGQYLSQQPYLSSPVFSQPMTSPGYYASPVPYGSEVAPAYLWDPSIFGDGALGSGFSGGPTVTGPKPNYPAASHTLAPPKPTLPSKSNILETKGSLPPLNVPPSTALHNQSLKPTNKVSQHGFQSPALLAKGYFPISKFPSFPSHGKSDLRYPNSPINIKANERGWGGTEKPKTRAKANGMSDFDLLNEQNRGPRTNSAKSAWVSEVGQAGSPGAEGKDNSSSSIIIRRDQYNHPDFPTKYEHAFFYVIKSYSEDDVHKSIKYNVWASTPNGNKRLDSAYQDAQERTGEKGSKCPVFLFFSVNASGQFCGIAEMTGHVDFNKNMDFWQQDKWNGFFPVKWHIIKDVPNPQFRHVILENNENKPVTNSRDTQEVKFPQGIEMLNIFKNFTAKTSILDDFGFYESRQKAMQEKRIRPLTLHPEQLQKADEGQHVTKAGDSNSIVAGDQVIELASSKKNKEIKAGVEAK